ncbi:MAG: ROK family protein [Parvularculaceae bacterium]|nr:ROK family protein [Parvularculaceae bacterium]
MTKARRIAAVEAGGTKFICAILDEDLAPLAQTKIATTTPTETLSAMCRFFEAAQIDHGSIDAAGIGSFGPLDLDRDSPTFGSIVTTPKLGWSDTDILGPLKDVCGAPACIDTDVNTAALAELRYGAARGLQDACYVTVGTGIGVGVVVGGTPLPSIMHAEAGHMRVPRHPNDTFAGICAFHDDCLEGMASGPAMKARWGTPAEELPADHAAWQIQAHYMAHMAVNLTYTLRPQRIILGGGVFGQQALYAQTRNIFKDLIAGYAPGPASDPGTFLVEPGVTTMPPGLLGAADLANDLIEDN